MILRLADRGLPLFSSSFAFLWLYHWFQGILEVVFSPKEVKEEKTFLLDGTGVLFFFFNGRHKVELKAVLWLYSCTHAAGVNYSWSLMSQLSLQGKCQGKLWSCGGGEAPGHAWPPFERLRSQSVKAKWLRKLTSQASWICTDSVCYSETSLLVPHIKLYKMGVLMTAFYMSMYCRWQKKWSTWKCFQVF